jgi:hypothetical protein
MTRGFVYTTCSGAYVAVGSKCEKLNVSKSGPLCPIERTSMGRTGTSLMGHFLTHASQQILSYSITSSARERSEGGNSRPIAFAVRRLITSSYLLGA